MLEAIKKKLRHTSIYKKYRNWHGKNALKNWEKAGKPLPPPHYYKQQTLLSFAQERNIKVFIETGTHRGSTLLTMLPYFEKLYSIEVFEALYKEAVNFFKPYQNVSLILGDSAEQMPLLLEKLNQPAIFWLDGHFSGEGTGKAQVNTPVMAELKAIMAHSEKHVIIIDDARHFQGKDDYPTVDAVKEWVLAQKKYENFELENDLIRIY